MLFTYIYRFETILNIKFFGDLVKMAYYYQGAGECLQPKLAQFSMLSFTIACRLKGWGS